MVKGEWIYTIVNGKKVDSTLLIKELIEIKKLPRDQMIKRSEEIHRLQK